MPATTHNARTGEVVFVNSEDVNKSPWTILFPANPVNNARVWVVDTSDTRPATAITYDFNGANYFHGRLVPTTGTTIDIEHPGESWQWVFNAGGNFWYPILPRLPQGGDIYALAAPVIGFGSTPTPIQLTANTSYFFSLTGGSTLTAQRPGLIRLDLYSAWTSNIANNQDAAILINDTIITGTPTVALGPLGDIFQSSRGGVFQKSAVSLGFIEVNTGDEINFVLSSDALQTGTSDLDEFVVLMTPRD